MKKLVILCITLFSLGVSGLSMALCPKSIALKNSYSQSVLFSVDPDPGFVPVVKAGQDYTLPSTFMGGCMAKNDCRIKIEPLNSQQPIYIDGVPEGSRIYFQYPGEGGYSIDKNANVRNCG